jgi:hypothetical protein
MHWPWLEIELVADNLSPWSWVPSDEMNDLHGNQKFLFRLDIQLISLLRWKCVFIFCKACPMRDIIHWNNSGLLFHIEFFYRKDLYICGMHLKFVCSWKIVVEHQKRSKFHYEPYVYVYVYWTAHHCDSWRIKDQLDVTCYFISLLMCSTCFGH